MIEFLKSATISRVIAHAIHTKSKNEEHSSYTCDDSMTFTDDAVITKLLTRVIDSCSKQSRAFKMMIDRHGEETFFEYCSHIFNDNNDESFIRFSKKITWLAAKSQRRMNSPGGILLIMQGQTEGENNFIVVIKAELQEAMIRRFDTSSNQQRLELLRDVFLSPAEKFYKVGFIGESSNENDRYPNNEYVCYIFDDQFRPGTGPAEFFYKDFLGLSIQFNEKYITKSFYEEVLAFINQAGIDHTTKQNCLVGLKAIMTDQIGIIDPQDYRDRYLPEIVHDDYNTMIESNPQFHRNIVRDTTLIREKLKKRVWVFRDNIKIVGPENSFADAVKVINTIEDAAVVLDENNATLVRLPGKPKEDTRIR